MLERMKFIKPYVRPVLRLARIAAIKVTDRLVASLPAATPERGRVLVVRLDAIGDYILWLDAARALRTLYPKKEFEVTLLANVSWSSLAVREDCFDKVLSFDRHAFFENPFYRFRKLMEVRTAGFWVAIQPTYSREYYYGDSVIRFSGAIERIGSCGDPARMTVKDREKRESWYTRLIPADDAPMMELERNAEFVRGLGMTEFQATLPVFSPASHAPGGLPDEYYVLFPGASAENKQWPVSCFAEIAGRVHSTSGLTAVLCGGNDDLRSCAELSRRAGVPVINMAGKTSIDELAAVIANARFLVTNDTVAVHVAAAVSTPSVCIMGGAHYGRFVPYNLDAKDGKPQPVAVTHDTGCFGCDWKCTHKLGEGRPVPCIAGVSVDEVWQCVEGML